MSLLTALVLALLAAVVLALMPPALAFLTVVAVLPFEAFGRIEAGFGVPPAYLFLLVVAAAVVMRQERIWSPMRAYKWLWVFLALAGLSIVFAPPLTQTDWHPAVAIRATLLRSPIQYALLLFHVLVFALTLHFGQDPQWVARALRIYLRVGAILIVCGIYQSVAVRLGLPGSDLTWAVELGGSSTYHYGATRFYSAGVVDFAPRATFKESLHFAHYLISFVPLAWACASHPSCARDLGWGRMRMGILAGLGSITVLLTFSRSGWAAFGVSLVCLALASKGTRGFWLMAGAIASMLAGLSVMSHLGLLTSQAGVLEALKARLAVERILMDPRILYLGVFLDTVLAHPLLGLGAGNFALVGAAAYQSATLHSAHGIFWAACADSGIPAMLALMAFFGTILLRLRKTWRARPTDSTGVLAVGLGAGLAGMLFQNLFVGDRPEMHLMFVVGLAACITHRAHRAKTPG